MSRDGLLQPLDGYLYHRIQVIYTSALKDVSFNGKTAPSRTTVMSMVAYNKTILDAAGLKQAPKNMDELLSHARHLREDRQSRLRRTWQN